MTTSALQSKLQKLIAHEKSAREIGNIAEAEAFAAKITELLFTHNMSMSDVEVREQEQNEPVEQERVDVLKQKTRAPWLESLAAAVADATFCKLLVIPGASTQVFVGRATDRQAAITLYSHLAGVAQSMATRSRERQPGVRHFAFGHRAEGGVDAAVAQVVAARLCRRHRQTAAHGTEDAGSRERGLDGAGPPQGCGHPAVHQGHVQEDQQAA